MGVLSISSSLTLHDVLLLNAPWPKMLALGRLVEGIDSDTNLYLEMKPLKIYSLITHNRNFWTHFFWALPGIAEYHSSRWIIQKLLQLIIQLQLTNGKHLSSQWVECTYPVERFGVGWVDISTQHLVHQFVTSTKPASPINRPWQNGTRRLMHIVCCIYSSILYVYIYMNGGFWWESTNRYTYTVVPWILWSKPMAHPGRVILGSKCSQLTLPSWKMHLFEDVFPPWKLTWNRQKTWVVCSCRCVSFSNWPFSGSISVFGGFFQHWHHLP